MVGKPGVAFLGLVGDDLPPHAGQVRDRCAQHPAGPRLGHAAYPYALAVPGLLELAEGHVPGGEAAHQTTQINDPDPEQEHAEPAQQEAHEGGPEPELIVRDLVQRRREDDCGEDAHHAMLVPERPHRMGPESRIRRATAMRGTAAPAAVPVFDADVSR